MLEKTARVLKNEIDVIVIFRNNIDNVIICFKYIPYFNFVKREVIPVYYNTNLPIKIITTDIKVVTIIQVPLPLLTLSPRRISSF